MQIAAQAAALFFTRRDQAFPRQLQISGKPHRVGGYPRLASQVIQQAAVSGCEGFAPGARSEQQFAHVLALIEERQEGEWLPRQDGGSEEGNCLILLQG